MLGKTNVKVKPNKFEILEFVSSIAPTTWEEIVVGTEYTATNEYGTWRIWADNYSTSNYQINYAFDGSNSSGWRSDNHSDSITPIYVGLDLPSGVSISPKDIYMKSYGEGNATNQPKLLGLNDDTGEWDELCVLDRHGTASNSESNYTLTTNSFYSKFKLELYRYSTMTTKSYIYEFQITSGLVKTGGGV